MLCLHTTSSLKWEGGIYSSTQFILTIYTIHFPVPCNVLHASCQSWWQPSLEEWQLQYSCVTGNQQGATFCLWVLEVVKTNWTIFTEHWRRLYLNSWWCSCHVYRLFDGSPICVRTMHDNPGSVLRVNRGQPGGWRWSLVASDVHYLYAVTW